MSCGHYQPLDIHTTGEQLNIDLKYYATQGLCADCWKRIRAERQAEHEEIKAERMRKAIDRIGGALAVLELPEEAKQIVTGCEDYESRVKMLELIADTMR